MFGDDVHVYYLDSGGGNMSVYIFPKSLNVYISIVQLFIIYKLYSIKLGKKRNNLFRNVPGT